MSNADIDFEARNIQERSYTTGEVFLTTRQVELIEKKEFAVAVLDPEPEVFVVHVAAFNVDLGDKVHPSKRAQIAHLKADKASFKVPNENVTFADIFSPKLVVELLEHTRINNHTIELMDDYNSYKALSIASSL